MCVMCVKIKVKQPKTITIIDSVYCLPQTCRKDAFLPQKFAYRAVKRNNVCVVHMHFVLRENILSKTDARNSLSFGLGLCYLVISHGLTGRGFTRKLDPPQGQVESVFAACLSFSRLLCKIFSEPAPRVFSLRLFQVLITRSVKKWRRKSVVIFLFASFNEWPLVVIFVLNTKRCRMKLLIIC